MVDEITSNNFNNCAVAMLFAYKALDSWPHLCYAKHVGTFGVGRKRLLVLLQILL